MELKEFNGRLNTSMFTNIEKALNSTELATAYPTDKFYHFEEKAIAAYAKEAIETSKSDLTKAMGQDSDSIIKKAEEDIKQLQRVLIVLDNGEQRTILIKAKTDEEIYKGKNKAKIEKVMKEFKEGTLKTSAGEKVTDRKQAIAIAMSEAGMSKIEKADEDTLEKALNDELEKGALTESLQYDNKMIFSKTGKELKEKLEVLYDKIEDEKLILSNKLDEMVDELPFVPTRKPSDWAFRGYDIKTGYKMFEWNQCNYYESTGVNSPAMAEGEIQAATSREEAKICQEWNSAVEKLIDLMVEHKSAKILKENLEDKKTYELTPKQLITFGFN